MEEAGKIIGYEYEAKNLVTNNIITNLKRVDDINTSIKITTDGEYGVTIKAIDEAGNKSTTKTINVYKDTEKPEVGELTITEENPDGFTMHLGATDDGSGIGKVECTVNGNKLPENQIEINQLTEAGVTFEVNGLEELSSYTIFVKVYDNAGNPSLATKEITAETIAAMDPPVITKGTVHAETIAVTANVKNGESRIRSYAFQISTSANTGFTTKETIDETGSTCPYIYEGLTPATKYYLRVIVTDNRGKPHISTAIEIQTYCKTSICSDAYSVKCTTCNGTGKIRTYCGTFTKYDRNWQSRPGTTRFCATCGETIAADDYCYRKPCFVHRLSVRMRTVLVVLVGCQEHILTNGSAHGLAIMVILMGGDKLIINSLTVHVVGGVSIINVLMTRPIHTIIANIILTQI